MNGKGATIEPVLKSIPEIIKQASQSQLGILALLIIVLFGLAIYFFRKAPMKVRALVFFMMFGGAVGYTVEIIRVASKPQSVHYVGRVLDRVTSAVLPESRIIVTLRKKPSLPYYADSEGQFSFWVERRQVSEDATLLVEHDRYEPYNRIVSSDIGPQLGDIRLVPHSENVALVQPTLGALEQTSGERAVPQPSIAVRPSPSLGARRPASASSSSPHTSGDAIPTSSETKVGVHTAHPLPSVVAEVQSERLPPQANVYTMMSTSTFPLKIVDNSSGSKLSGKGKDWSPWYIVKVGAAPAGYTVQKAVFWLSGDRTCGAWAECNEVIKNDTEVKWEFRLQGHDEWGAPPQAYSEGHLRVFYGLK